MHNWSENCKSSNSIKSFRLIHFTLFVCLVLSALVTNSKAEDLNQTKIYPNLGHQNSVLSVAFSPDGKTLASGSQDNTVKLWEVSTGKELRTFSGHQNWVLSVAFSPDGKTLASGSHDNTVKLWEVSTGKELRTFSGHQNSVLSVAFSPDGKTLASGSQDNAVKLWEVSTGKELRTFSGHQDWVLSVAFSPDGKTLASGSQDNTVKLWEVSTGKELRPFSGHQDWVLSFAFSPDGKTLASGSHDNTIKLWEVSTGKELRTFSGHQNSVLSVAFSPDGKTLASGSQDNTVKLWEVSTGKELRTFSGHQNWVFNIAFSPDGKTLASGSHDNTVKLWEVSTGKELRTFSGHQNSVLSIAFSPDGKTLASGSQDNTVKLWEVNTGKELRTFSGHQNSVLSVAFSPDGKTLASGSQDNTVKLWEVSTGKELRTFSGHQDWVLSVAFSPDGKTLASGSHDNTVKLWEVSTGKELRPFSGHQDWVLSVAFSPDGKTLASGSQDNAVKLWEVSTGKELRTFSGHQDWVLSVAFSPDGKTLASGSQDNTVKLWEVSTGKELRTFSGHQNWVFNIAFSPDGKTLASGSHDNTIKLWEVSTGKELRTFSGHQNSVLSVAFSPDGKTLASGSQDNTVKLWEIDNGTLQKILLSLPATQWISWLSMSNEYIGSLQAEQDMLIRFDNDNDQVYPLDYFPEFKVDNLSQATRNTSSIKPATIHKLKHWWEYSPFRDGSITVILVVFAALIIFVFTHHKKIDPLSNTIRFFNESGYSHINSIDGKYLFFKDKKQKNLAAALWDQQDSIKLLTSNLSVKSIKDSKKLKQLYLLIKPNQKIPSNQLLQEMRQELGNLVIPLSMNIVEAGIAGGNSKTRLHNLEEKYIVRTDPYLESRPIEDPVWFFGREQILADLQVNLTQGQHAAVFGLRKIGKTSVIKQIQQRFIYSPTVSIDCQSVETLEQYFTEILKEFRFSLKLLGFKNLGDDSKCSSMQQFKEEFMHLFDLWRNQGHQEPVIIIFDEIDKLFRNRKLHDSEKHLAIYVSLFQALRSLAQDHNACSIMVAAYRPDINRHNILSEALPDNPMYKSFSEFHLGFLDESDSNQMITDIGSWQDIVWTEDALQHVFTLFSGHPLLTRFFASEATKQGQLKNINLNIIEDAEKNVKDQIRNNDIGNYYLESIWHILSENEQQLLLQFAAVDSLTGEDISIEFDDEFSSLINLGLIYKIENKLAISGQLFEFWLKRRI